MAFNYRDYASRVRHIESRNNYRESKKKKGSSASGAYQFLDKTWQSYGNRAYARAYEAPDAEQDAAFDRFTAANQAMLDRAGVRVTPGSSYLAHFAGPGTAIKAYQADPSTPIADVVGSKAVRANPGVFGKVKTAGDLISWADMKVGGAPVAARPMNPQEAVDAAGPPGTYGEPMAYNATPTAAPRRAGPFESLLGGVAGMLGGVGDAFNKVDGAVDGVVNKVESVIDGDPTDATSAAPAKKADDGFFGDTTTGAVLGALVGGYFGGPMGSMVGGMIGQGINRSLTKTATAAQVSADEAQTSGLMGGVGRSVDNLFGSMSTFFGGVPENLAFETATERREQSDRAGLNARGREVRGESKQFDRAVRSGKGGLW